MIRKLVCGVGAAGASLLAATAAFAQDATEAATEAAATATDAATTAAFTPTAEMVNKGDVAWMLVASALVLLMSVPALALFYGGLVRAKNMLSVLMQCFVIACVMMIMWCVYGYSVAQTMAYVLEKCGNDLTRENVMKQAASMKNLSLEMLLPGITINTSATDFAPLQQDQMQRSKAEGWERFGPVFDAGAGNG